MDRQLRGGRGGDCGTSPAASQLGGEGGDGWLPAGGGPIRVGGVGGGAGGQMGGVPQSEPRVSNRLRGGGRRALPSSRMGGGDRAGKERGVLLCEGLDFAVPISLPTLFTAAHRIAAF